MQETGQHVIEMHTLIVYLGLFVLGGVLSEAALSKDVIGGKEELPEVNRGIDECEIRLTPEQKAILAEDNNGQRKATSDLVKRWTDATVPYVIEKEEGIDAGQIEQINTAIDHWKKRTCLRFVLRTNQTNYVAFVNNGTGCRSFVGMIGGKQLIQLASDCYWNTIIHEIGHAIGFWHEHKRPDRDQYITVNYDNILEAQKYNFKKLNPSDMDIHNIPYDISSIMHYSQTAFSSNGQPTISAKNPANNYKFDANKGLSAADIRLANLMYGCIKDCKDSSLTCPWWSSQGECKANPTWMLNNCKSSCGSCARSYCTDVGQSVWTNCAALAADGYCSINQKWMERNCRRSCNFCDSCCVDKRSDCARLAANGECETNKNDCKLSCNNCADCDCIVNKDFDPRCKSWADSGECIKNPGFMLINCRKSCNVCNAS